MQRNDVPLLRRGRTTSFRSFAGPCKPHEAQKKKGRVSATPVAKRRNSEENRAGNNHTQGAREKDHIQFLLQFVEQGVIYVVLIRGERLVTNGVTRRRHGRISAAKFT